MIVGLTTPIASSRILHGNFAQQGDVSSDGQRREKVECTAVGVGQRQERERASAALEIVVPVWVFISSGEEHVARQVIDREHDAFRISRGSRRVIEQDDPIVGYFGVFDVVDAESARILGAVILQMSRWNLVSALPSRS